MFTSLALCAVLTSASPQDVVDQIRRDHGLPAVRSNLALRQAAEAHVRYMVLNETAGHREDPDRRAFVGQTPGDRARRFGYNGPNSEAVAWGNTDLDDMLKALFDAPYHRVLFLQPSAPDFGAAYADGALCVKFGGKNGDGAVVSPPNGARNVRTSWDGAESPDPLRKTNLRGPVGYPVVLALFGSEARDFRSINATLTGPNGRVPAIVLTPATDEHADNAVILIPQRPLARATAYTATFAYRNKTGERTVRASFSTAR